MAQIDFDLPLSDANMHDMIKAIDEDNDGQVGTRVLERRKCSCTHLFIHVRALAFHQEPVVARAQI